MELTEEQQHWIATTADDLREISAHAPKRIEIQVPYADNDSGEAEIFVSRASMIRTAALLLECALMDVPSSVPVPDAVGGTIYISDTAVLDRRREDNPGELSFQAKAGLIALLVYLLLSIVVGAITVPYWLIRFFSS